ncbi:glycoside hydrolase family 3 protein [Clostridium gasigenes]|uniref:glycoside hydrolase family 3 protein n=1 Tax=Clostridium gasigenes TaxID=94869 RepID=UPI001C0B23A8|nr:glycoside hydrolase family 3 N-terminal domain-containing protein [Clostridium gasigenes]MBU3130991.1 glycoside hydrolase family 3 protein [Clostridium gasigenes]
MSVDLSKKPFYLNKEQIKWVNDTKDKMTVDEKIGQLLFTMAADDKSKTLEVINEIKPGGVMLRPMKAKQVIKAHNKLQENAKIPMFLAANLEAGPNGLAEEGTEIGNEMLVAATNNPENAFKLGEACIKEAKALGGNMAFAPLIDINFNWENPIASTRCFGDNIDLISKMGQAYTNGVQKHGGSVTLKHFPGDGVDGRDQHVIKTINSLSYPDWKASFGRVYKENIDNGATGVMVGHIAFPAYYDEKNIEGEDRLTPGSLSENLLNGLLREELGFNGLIMTDSTLMTGFGAHGKREDLVPMCIASGNDMLLFTKSPLEDYEFMLNGYKKGIITDERLDDALSRILGLKAHQRLNTSNNLVPEKVENIGTAEHKKWAKDIADQGITLVQNNEGLIPLNKNKIKKIGIIPLGCDDDIFELLKTSKSLPLIVRLALKLKKPSLKKYEKFINSMTKEGFTFEVIDHSDILQGMKQIMQTMEDFKKQYDLIIYFINKQPKSNQTNLRVEYKSIGGFDSPWFVKEIPTMMISVGNPYHQYDLENVETVINAYTSTEEVIESLVEKLVGKSKFKGKSPVKLEFNPFVGDISKWI